MGKSYIYFWWEEVGVPLRLPSPLFHIRLRIPSGPQSLTLPNNINNSRALINPLTPWKVIFAYLLPASLTRPWNDHWSQSPQHSGPDHLIGYSIRFERAEWVYSPIHKESFCLLGFPLPQLSFIPSQHTNNLSTILVLTGKFPSVKVFSPWGLLLQLIYSWFETCKLKCEKKDHFLLVFVYFSLKP